MDEVLWALGINTASALKAAIEALPVDATDVKEAMYRMCLSFHARKMFRATLAGLTLIRFSQSTQALTLKREQYYSWVAFHYYSTKREDAILFIASQPLRQRDKALQQMELQPDLKDNDDWNKKLAAIEQLCERTYREFPALRQAKGKSASSPSPKMIDWPEPSVGTMLRIIVRDWPNQLATMGEPVPDDDIDSWIEREARHVHFLQGDFMSQDVHSTPLAVGDAFPEATGGSLGPVRIDTHEPNALIYIYLWDPLGVLSELVQRYRLPGFKDKLIKLQTAAKKQKENYNF